MSTRQIRSKRYWARVAGYFIWFLLTYTLISYVFKEAEDAFWSLKEIQGRSIFAFFMSIIFAYRHREEQIADEINEEGDNEKQPWTVKQFFGILGLMLFFSFLVMTVLFAIGWLVMEILYDETTPIGPVFVRMSLITVVMTFFAVLVLFLSERFGIHWGRKQAR